MEADNNSFSYYLKQVKKSAIALVAASTALGIFKPDSPYSFPPIKSLSAFVVPFFWIAICGGFLIAWFINSKRIVKRLGILSCILIPVLLVVYATLIYNFVISIEIPAKRTEAHVIVGYKKSDLAEFHFDGTPNDEMLRQVGYDEPTLNMLFIGRRSVIYSIFLVYVAIPFFLALAIGCATRRSQLETG